MTLPRAWPLKLPANWCGSLSLRQLGVSEEPKLELEAVVQADSGADLPVLSGPADQGVSLNFEGPGQPCLSLTLTGPSLA